MNKIEQQIDRGRECVKQWEQQGYAPDAEVLRQCLATMQALYDLKKYAHHDNDCASMDRADGGWYFSRHDWKCTCGLRKILDNLREVEDGQR